MSLFGVYPLNKVGSELRFKPWNLVVSHLPIHPRLVSCWVPAPLKAVLPVLNQLPDFIVFWHRAIVQVGYPRVSGHVLLARYYLPPSIS